MDLAMEIDEELLEAGFNAIDDCPQSEQRWLAAFVYYYTFQRPNQALNNRPPVEEVQKR